MNKGLSTAEILKLKEDDREAVEKFFEFSSWTDEDYIEYNKLLMSLEQSYGKCKNNAKDKIDTKSKGNALEDIVNFIIEKSYFLEVYPNKRNATNEIDQLIVVSCYGEQTLDRYGISRNLLGFKGDFFLGECKNYYKKVGVTWVGKFNTLLKICGDCEFGIIFSYLGLTGDENKWEHAHGLTKVIYINSNTDHKKYILDFNINDFNNLKNKDVNFFKLIKSKKLALATGCKSESLYKPHNGEKRMKTIYNGMLMNKTI